MNISKFSKNHSLKTLAVIVAAMIAGGSLSVLTYAAVSNKKNDTVSTSSQSGEESTDKKESSVSKDETVYVLANADGSVKKIIVSDWIKNTANSGTLNDNTDLRDVKNVKGDESYTIDSNNMRVWNAEGDDIYYQGTTDKALPVDLAISYKLDGKTVSAKEIAGKSGKVTIRFDYKNNQFEYVDIDGVKTKIYVPFIMLTGMVLDGNNFKNVAVTNGKVIGDGDRMAVIGFALPGLEENLNVASDKLEIPSYVEITADTTDFELETTMTIATNNVFNELDLEKVDSIDKLASSMNSLTDAMKQLMDGSSALYNGLNTLMAKSSELISGIDKLADGANKISAGAVALNSGLKELISNNTNLTEGALKVYNTLLGTVNTQISEQNITIDKLTAENYSEVLNNLLSNPNDTQKAELIAIAKQTAAEQLKAAGVPDEYTDAVLVMIFDRIKTGESYETALNNVKQILTDAVTVQIVAANKDIPADPTIYQILLQSGKTAEQAGLVAKLCSYKALSGGKPTDYINDCALMAANAAVVQNALADQNAQVKINGLCLTLAKNTLSETISGVLKQLDSYNEFYQGLLKYTNGVKTAYDGTNTLIDGTNQLKDGIGQLQSGSSQLVDGIKQLDNGAMQLNDGLKQFNEQGVAKLTEAVNGDIGELITRLKATADVSKNYKTFAGISDEQDGNVKFIYKTDAIQK